MGDALFAYGTLELPVVFERVAGIASQGLPAALRGHRCAMLRGRNYPAIIPSEGRGRVDGVLHRGISAAGWRRLDAFEADEYERRRVEVELATGEWVDAQAYVLRPVHAALLGSAPWDRAAFERDELERLLEAIAVELRGIR